MNLLLASFSGQPMPVAVFWLWLVVPICMTVSLVYKATKIDRFKDIFPAAALMFLTMIGGLALVTIALWLLPRL